MTTKTPPTVELPHRRSHWIELGYGPLIERETVSLTYATEWRGAPVLVHVDCDRYKALNRSSDGSERDALTPWRVIVRTVIVRTPHERTDDDWREGKACSETARTRLADVIEPLASAWLDSDAYRLSESSAYKFAILRELRDAVPTYDKPTERTRRHIATHDDKLIPLAKADLLRACDAFDAYAVAYTEANDA